MCLHKPQWYILCKYQAFRIPFTTPTWSAHDIWCSQYVINHQGTRASFVCNFFYLYIIEYHVYPSQCTEWININHTLFMDVIISFHRHIIRCSFSVPLLDSFWLWMLNQFSKTSKTPSSKKLSLTIFVKKNPLQKYLLSNYYPVLFSIKLRIREIYI